MHVDLVKRKDLQISGRAQPAAAEDTDVLELVGCGRAVPGHEIRIVDPLGHELGEREEGRLQFRGPSAAAGYYRNPEATRSLFNGDWLDSGDYAYFADGDLFITGRAKDIIIRAGRNIHPQELEQAVGEISGVRKGCVAVFASRDQETAADRLIVVAETRLKGKESKEKLKVDIRRLSMQLLEFYPDDVVIAPPRTVPKTSSGKIRRSAARELYESGRIKKKVPVWLQFFHLLIGGSLPLLVRYLRVAAGFCYAAYVGLIFGLMAFPTYLLMIFPGLKFRRTGIFWLAKLFFRLIGIPCSLVGKENYSGQRCILVCNHASYLDGFVLTALLPPDFSFIAKNELLNNFFVAVFLRRVGTQFVERFDVKESVESIGKIEEALRAGQSLVFFPEGTFFRSAGMRPFRMGAFIIAAGQNVPVVPVAIKGTRSILRGSEFFPRPGRVQVTIGPPIEPQGEDFSAAARVRDAAREFILRHCGEPDLASEGTSGFFSS